MSAAHEPTIHYLDSILNEEEKRCDQYSHQWRNFTISRSGRFRSKNKKRDVVDGKLFDGKENDKISARNTSSSAMSKSSSYATSATANPSASSTAATTGTGIGATSMRSQRDNKTESYKSCYETSL